MRVTQKQITQEKQGFFFSNILGVPLKFTVSDHNLDEELKARLILPPTANIKNPDILNEMEQKARKKVALKNPKIFEIGG